MFGPNRTITGSVFIPGDFVVVTVVASGCNDIHSGIAVDIDGIDGPGIIDAVGYDGLWSKLHVGTKAKGEKGKIEDKNHHDNSQDCFFIER